MQGADQKEQQHPSTTHVPLAHRPLVVPAGQPPNCKGVADPTTIMLVREKVGTSPGNVEINSIHHQSTGNGTWSSVHKSTKSRMLTYARLITVVPFLVVLTFN